MESSCSWFMEPKKLLLQNLVIPEKNLLMTGPILYFTGGQKNNINYF